MHPSFLALVLFSQKSPEHSGNSKLSRHFYAYFKRCSAFILFVSHKLPKAKSHEIVILFLQPKQTLLLFSICTSNGCGYGNSTYLLAETSSELNLWFYANPRTLTHLIQLVNAICIHHALVCMPWLSITLAILSFSFSLERLR